jgi:hypothetical protein
MLFVSQSVIAKTYSMFRPTHKKLMLHGVPETACTQAAISQIINDALSINEVIYISPQPYVLTDNNIQCWCMGVCKKKQNPSNCDKMFKTY